MKRRYQLALAAAIVAIAPALAQAPDEPDARIKEYNDARDLLKAQREYNEERNKQISTQLQPLQSLAGTGQTTIGTGGGEMEAAYLSGVSMTHVATAINRRVDQLLADRTDRPQNNVPAIVALTGAETFNFDRLGGFQAEVTGLVQAFDRALESPTGESCEPPVDTSSRGGPPAALLAALGPVLGLLQSDVEIRGFSGMGDDAMLVRALIGDDPGKYALQTGIIEPPGPTDTVDDDVNRRLTALELCEATARTKLNDVPAADRPKHRLTALLTRLDTFRDRVSTAAADGTVPLAVIIRQAQFQRFSPYILRVFVQRAGGTLIRRRNILTALGAPTVRLSGGVIAQFTLTHRATGWVRSGMITCRTGLTGLGSAMRLQNGDVTCAIHGARRPEDDNRLRYDRSVFERLSEQ